MFDALVNLLVDKIGSFGYLGIVILMFLESSFFPFPSEVVMIPAGYLAYKGQMNLVLAILFGVLGSYIGALFNYYLSLHLGRKFLERYGRYFLIDNALLSKLDNFFENHGHISTFTGRLIIGIRQYISIPAGLSKMPLGKFSIYTILGAGIWVGILVFLGYFLGSQEDIIKAYLREISIGIIVVVLIIVGIYSFLYLRKKKKQRTKKN
jgi:membrane protein DedA with SNARE-associated domain